MFQLSISILFFVFITTYSFYLEVQDTQKQRKANVWGIVNLIHQEKDNKLALIMEGAVMNHYIGEPDLTILDIDIMHQIEYHFHRFEPQNMKVLEQIDDGYHMMVLAYQSRKSPNMIYRFHFSPQSEELINQIRDFINLYQRQESIDLLANIPEELRNQLQQQQLKALQKLNDRQEL